MNRAFTSFDSRLRIYWRFWISAAALVLVLRFTVFPHASRDHRFYLALVFVLGTWLPIILFNAFESHRLSKRLKERHPSTWQSLNTFSLRFFPALLQLCSSDDLGDPTVAALKEERRRFGRFAAIAFFTYPVMFLVVAL